MANEYFSPLQEVGRALKENAIGVGRAALGQGLGMGWGDEAEAKARAAITGRPVEEELAQIRQEYAEYVRAHPTASGVAEFIGAALPAAAAMVNPFSGPVAIPTATTTLGRLTSPLMRIGQGIKRWSGAGKEVGKRTLAENAVRGAVAGGVEGAISGAGGADSGMSNRLMGAGVGGTLGAGLGLGFGFGIPFAGAVARRIGDAFPGEESIKEGAARRIWRSLGPVSVEEMERRMKEDASMGVPSFPMNVSRGTVREAETMAQRPRDSANIIGEGIGRQRAGVRDRITGQVADRLASPRYFEESEQLVENLANRARPLYQAAEAVGEVTDPVILNLMQHPKIREAYSLARNAANIRKETAKAFGEDPAEFDLARIMQPTGQFDPAAVQALRDMGIPEEAIPNYLSRAGSSAMEMVETVVPDVKTLHQIKLGLYNMVEDAYSSNNKAKRESARALEELYDRFLERFDEVVPEYAQARKFYSDQKTVQTYLDNGYNNFLKLKPEELTSLWKNIPDEGAEAFRIGAARALTGLVTGPSANRDYANRLIGSPDMQKNLKTIFPSESQYNLFMAALGRESEIYNQAMKVLSGSQTASRMAAAADFEEDPVAIAASGLANQNFSAGLVNSVLNWMSSRRISDEVADQVAKWLTSSDPTELAAAIKALEKTVPEMSRASAAIAGGVPAGALGVMTGSEQNSDRGQRAEEMGFGAESELSEEDLRALLEEFQ